MPPLSLCGHLALFGPLLICLLSLYVSPSFFLSYPFLPSLPLSHPLPLCLLQGGYRAGKTAWENAARFAYGFKRMEQNLAVAVDLKDTYSRVQFKLLMELLVQYDVSLTLTKWLAAALQERKVAIRFGNWISTPQQLTMGLSQGSPPPLPQSSAMSTQRDWRI